VAEAAATTVRRRGVDGDAFDRGEARQRRRDQRELVFAPAALERREVGGDLLEAEDVEVGERARVVDDALRVDAAVAAAAPLNVPGDELHRGPGQCRRAGRDAHGRTVSP